MTTQDPNATNPGESLGFHHKDGLPVPNSRIVAELRSIYSKHLTEGLQKLLAVVDDELFKRSEKSESLDQQSMYFGAMRHIRVWANSLQANFHQQVGRGFDEFWRQKQGAATPLRGANAGVDQEETFSLVENEVLEEEIATSAMIEKGNNLFQNDLFAINKRFAFLLGQEEFNPDDNPLAPAPICNAFSAALKALSSDLSVTLLIYKLFDQVVLTNLGHLYAEINAYLVQEGILPSIKTTRRFAPPGSTAYPGVGAHGTELSPEENQQAYVEMFQGMQRLLDGWRVQMGYPPAHADGSHGQPVFETGEVITALNMIQTPAGNYPTYPVGSEGLKAYITGELSRLQPGESRPLGRAEEDIIDMVALIFDFILEDRNLPDPIKGLIARLQIPVVKVAIIEKSFFARKNHPVRLLLNALAQAGIGLDPDAMVTNTPVYKRIESVVTRILDEFEQNVELFSDLLDEFMGFMEKETQRSRVAEERTRQVTRSKEQLHLAKRKIAYEIATRLEGKPTPSPVRSFLYNTWKDVLVLAYLRRDIQPGDWDAALHIMDKLIWSVAPPEDAAMRKAIIQTIPKLLKGIRAGLESISLDPQSVASALKELESCHVARLSKPLAESPGGPGPAAAAPDEDEIRPVEIHDPELAQAFTEIRGNLPDVENLTVQDIYRSPEHAGTDASGKLEVDNSWLAKARALEVGEWLEFDDEDKSFRGKLSWKSQVTSAYVFVNRKGAKVLDITLDDLAKRMSQNRARLIEDADVPLMDRAFGALISKLKTPSPKPA